MTSIPVPDAPEEVKARIHEAVVKSYALRDESNDLLHHATALLREALKLPSVTEMGGARFRAPAVAQERDPPVRADVTMRVPPEGCGCGKRDSSAPLCFSVSLAALGGRFDGSYHVPIVREIEEHLHASAAEVATVGDRRVSKSVILPGRFKRVYVEEGYGRPMIGGKQLGELDPSGKKYLSTARHKKEFDALAVSENTILVTRSGTIGKVALTPRHWNSWIPSDHILRVVPASNDIAGFLYVWLSSEWAKPLILRNSYGAVIDEISDEQLAAVPVPLLTDKVLQSEINDLALRASALRSDAYDLEQSALRELETKVCEVNTMSTERRGRP